MSAGEGADALAAPPSEDQCAARRAVEGPRTRARTIKACYERELAQDPTLRGTVWVEFVVLPDGSVDVISTESTVTPTVGACVAEVIGTLQYTPCPGYPSTRHRPPIVFEHG